MNTRLTLGRAGSHAEFEHYDLGDLLAIRQPEPSATRPDGGRRDSGGQADQLRFYTAALGDEAADVLAGNHSVFRQLAERGRVAAGRVCARRNSRT